MSTLIQNHFADLEDITEDEFKEFFKFYGNEKERDCLDRDYKILKKADDKVSFADISDHYSTNYNALLELLENTESVRGTLAKYTKSLQDAEEDIRSGDTFKTNKIVVDFIILLDIYQILKNVRNMAKKIFERKFDSFKSFQKYGANTLKIGHLSRIVLQEYLADEHHEQPAQQSAHPPKEKIEVPAPVLKEIVIQELPNKAFLIEKIDDFSEKFANLTRDLENIRKELGAPSNLVSQPYFPGSTINSAQKEFLKQENKNIDDMMFQMEKTDGLTNNVWPKSRMLLAIVSKMSKEELLNKEQRGILKDLIIENDPRILNCLRQYEMDGDRKNLYKNCLNLAASIKK